MIKNIQKLVVIIIIIITTCSLAGLDKVFAAEEEEQKSETTQESGDNEEEEDDDDVEYEEENEDNSDDDIWEEDNDDESIEDESEEETSNTTSTKAQINREVRTSIDTTNKNVVKVQLKDLAGISSINIITYKSDNTKIKEYEVKGEECNKNKNLDKTLVKFKGYNAKTQMATIEIKKQYFIKKSKNKDKKLTLYIETKDTSGLISKEKVLIQSTSKGWNANRGARVSFSYNKGKLNLVMSDNDGIATDKARLEVYDLENSSKKVLNYDANKVNRMLTEKVVNKNNKIIKGTVKLNISKFKKSTDGKYKIKVKAVDANGRARVETIKLKGATENSITANTTKKKNTTKKSKSTKTANTTKKKNTTKKSKSTKTANTTKKKNTTKKSTSTKKANTTKKTNTTKKK